MTSHGIDNSAKLSAYLAAGCLSPREVHAAAEELLQVGGSAGEGAACLQMHLTIRCSKPARVWRAVCAWCLVWLSVSCHLATACCACSGTLLTTVEAQMHLSASA